MFIIKYMKTFGLNVNNEGFENHSWYFRNALVRANYNDLKNGIHATTEFLEKFFSNLMLGTKHELKNRYMHVNYIGETEGVNSQSAIPETPKCQIGTLECTLEELAILKLIIEDNEINQNEITKRTGKSLRTVKRIMEALQEKEYIRRVNGKRYGWWEVLVDII